MNKSFDNLKVCVIASDSSGCGNYRVIIPYNNLINRGFKQFKIFTVIPSFDILKTYDVIMFQRVEDYNPLPMFYPYYRPLNLMKELKKLGKILIHEVDDNLFKVNPSNPCYTQYLPQNENIHYHKEALLLADYIHVTNINLKNALIKQLNISGDNIYCFDNAIDINSPYYINKRHLLPQDKIIIGYQGGSTHEDDIKLIVEPVRHILKKNKNVMFALCSNPHYIKKIGIPKNQTIMIPPESNFNLFLSIPSMFDIGLVPLQNNEFNRCKSSLKIHEFAAYKIPTVCSDIDIYRKHYSELKKDQSATIHDVNIVAKNTKKDWIDSIQKLIDDYTYRSYLGLNAYEMSTNDYSESSLCQINNRRVDFYRSLCKSG